MSYVYNPFTGILDRDTKNSGDSTTAERLTVTKIAGETISALQMVYADNDTDVLVANNSTYNEAKTIGLALNAANATDDVTVLLFGQHEDNSFSFTLNEPLFLTSS